MSDPELKEWISKKMKLAKRAFVAVTEAQNILFKKGLIREKQAIVPLPQREDIKAVLGNIASMDLYAKQAKQIVETITPMATAKRAEYASMGSIMNDLDRFMDVYIRYADMLLAMIKSSDFEELLKMPEFDSAVDSLRMLEVWTSDMVRLGVPVLDKKKVVAFKARARELLKFVEMPSAA
jgi:hypothetical protein